MSLEKPEQLDDLVGNIRYYEAMLAVSEDRTNPEYVKKYITLMQECIDMLKAQDKL